MYLLPILNTILQAILAESIACYILTMNTQDTTLLIWYLALWIFPFVSGTYILVNAYIDLVHMLAKLLIYTSLRHHAVLEYNNVFVV